MALVDADKAFPEKARQVLTGLFDQCRALAEAAVWTRGILERRPVRLVTVALANKMARIAWALMTRKEVYRAKGRVATATEAAA